MPDEKQIANIKYWVGFSMIPSMGPKRFARIRKHFADLSSAWSAPMRELEKAGLEENVIAEIIRLRQDINLEREMEKLEREQVRVVAVDDKNYPKLLKEIYYPPFILYYRGRLPEPEDYLLAVVGTRKFSQYGQQVTRNIVHELAAGGLTIVSGLAIGIDALAHNSTLDAGGKTIAVLGCGVEKINIYPVSNRALGEKIIAQDGCIISEHPLSTPPFKHHFPRRNRIISGLSLGTLIIEAPQKSGSLITAMHALEQNREVFAVPQNIISQNSTGVNNLIKMGAKLVTEANDVLEALNLTLATEFLQAQKVVADSPKEAQILEALTREPTHVDELIRLTKLSASSINSTLAIMEMKGKVRQLGGMMYVLGR